jgi:hypothetical protein
MDWAIYIPNLANQSIADKSDKLLVNYLKWHGPKLVLGNYW